MNSKGGRGVGLEALERGGVEGHGARGGERMARGCPRRREDDHNGRQRPRGVCPGGGLAASLGAFKR